MCRKDCHLRNRPPGWGGCNNGHECVTQKDALEEIAKYPDGFLMEYWGAASWTGITDTNKTYNQDATDENPVPVIKRIGYTTMRAIVKTQTEFKPGIYKIIDPTIPLMEFVSDCPQRIDQ